MKPRCCAYSRKTRLRPGVYRSARVTALHEALVKAGINAEISDDIRRTIWEKYVFLVGLSGSTTTMRSTIGPIRQNPQTRAFLHDLMKEVVAHKMDLFGSTGKAKK